MTSAREELHALIDAMPEEELKDWLLQIRQSKENSSAMLAWLEHAELLQNELVGRYGILQDSVSILEEIRQERLNDLMGGR
jgi:hypothetical protein